MPTPEPGTRRYFWTKAAGGFAVWCIQVDAFGKSSIDHIGIQASKQTAKILAHSMNTIEEAK